ncbi:TPA: hypothetical protein NII19_007090 [Pseudomonas aeruginosa]|uniref:hypothetical protein n=1 Tax=Pseudomonas aeruginosa TaxID=287 RepID=UPI0007336CC4|nr:hypothetical protein [Pseudomonas aeruginosa]KTF49771.1 hypothetical protein WM51_26520 [Pseudomonas aeruginosa]HCF4748546.1 hypothetical protein [Pseudomonas aeruginosa]HCF4768859.1 hypothetical protein [Pseudomonas aeruginosa]HCF6284788.1 hypothetical protein [Pseudomonas aeruginosa]HCF6291989.1 hypothetical protein [Pseudomonas aeruginosa]
MARQTKQTIGLAALAIAALGVMFAQPKDIPDQQWDFRTFNRTIKPGNAGCEIRAPDGRLMNDAFEGDVTGRTVIPKGTTLTIQCFPLQSGEKWTQAQE